MTRERKITLLILAATLAIGVLLGLLIPGFSHKYRRHSEGRQSERRSDGRHRRDIPKKDWFAEKLFQVVGADSSQMQQIRPVSDWAASEIEALEISSNAKMSEILDSVKVQLQPVLTKEQQDRLNEFQEKTRGRWKGGDKAKR